MQFKYVEQMGASRKLSFEALVLSVKDTNSSVPLLNPFSEGQNEHTQSRIIHILLSNLQIFFSLMRPNENKMGSLQSQP